MAEFTKNLSIEKPVGNENFRREVINSNMDKIDDMFGIEAGKGHSHDGTAGQGKKISYNSLTDKPSNIAPSAHKATHATGGSDALAPSDIGAATKAELDAHKADYVRQPAFAATAGTSTAYTATLSPALGAYTAGVGITIVPHVDCGASPTLNINGLGAKQLLKQDGTAYAAGDLKANTPYSFKYVGTSFLADSSGGLDDFFGDGSDGALNLVSSTVSGNMSICVGGTAYYNPGDSYPTQTNALNSFPIGFGLLSGINIQDTIGSNVIGIAPNNGSLGIDISPSTNVVVSNLQLYCYASTSLVTKFTIYDSSAKIIAQVTSGVLSTGWNTVSLTTSVPLEAGKNYRIVICGVSGSGQTVNPSVTAVHTKAYTGAVSPAILSIPVTLHSGIAIKQYASINTDSLGLITTDNPCQGLILYSQGDVTINGAIDMSQKAGLAPNGNPIPMIIADKLSSTTGIIVGYTDNLCVGITAISGGDASGTPKTDAFNGNGISTWWQSSQTGAGVPGVAYIGCLFSTAKHIRKIILHQMPSLAINSIKVQRSDNGSTWSDVATVSLITGDITATYFLPESGASLYWRFLANATPSTNWGINHIEMMESIVAVPTSTSKLKKYMLSANLLTLLGGYGGNGGYGGGNAGASRSNGGIGGKGRQNLGGFGGGGGGGYVGSGGNGGNGGNIDLAESGGGYNYSASAIGGMSGGGGFAGQNGAGGSGKSWSGSAGAATGGAGGKCNGGGGGGGGGASAAAQTAPNGGDAQYAGGFILIIAKGNITIGSSASIKANGGNGGNGSAGAGTASGGGGGGGGSGGGVVALLYKGSFTNSGTIQVNGGAGGSGGVLAGTGENGGPGVAGSVGTIFTQKL